jgi:hypothetical protein
VLWVVRRLVLWTPLSRPSSGMWLLYIEARRALSTSALQNYREATITIISPQERTVFVVAHSVRVVDKMSVRLEKSDARPRGAVPPRPASFSAWLTVKP